jgi:hypothetical protein
MRRVGVRTFAASARLLGLVAVAGLAVLPSCKDPMPFSTLPVVASPASSAASVPTAFEDCPASAEWFPTTPPLRMFAPAPHPDTECPFYRGAYQSFLVATQPDSLGRPALVHYATGDDVFRSATPHAARNTAGRAWLGTVLQAGYRNVLIDQDGHTLYYGLHMNQAFVDFIRANNLQTVSGILNVDPTLSFPPGLVELKTAWKDIDPADFPGGKVPPPGGYPGDPGDYSNYITTTAWVSHLSQDAQTGAIVEDPNHPRLVKVALVAVHAVYTLPGHPEFIWGSIQHVNLGAVDATASAAQGATIFGAPDDQPDPAACPVVEAADGGPGDPENLHVTTVVSPSSFLLYKGGTPENQADQPYTNQQLVFDEASQSFPGQRTSMYRMFPGSKSQQVGPDTAVMSLNANLTGIAQQQLAHGPLDVRLNYHLVSAVWMDKPVLFGLGANGQGMSLQNDDGSNPLVIDAVTGHGIDPQINEGTTCGTPLGPNGGSGDVPGAANTVPGCRTRADVLMAGGTAQVAIENDLLANGTDSPFSILGGEDRLSSTAMESFTQSPVAFPNCFSCHNTEPITANGVPASRDSQSPVIIAKPALINVSHLFSDFVMAECGGAPNAACGAP